MLKPVRVGKKDFDKYRDVVGYPLHAEVKKLAKDLKGARLLHVNATARGGGVAQILYSMVPLQKDLGLDAHWKIIQPKNLDFYVATKKIHNSLQGAEHGLTKKEWALYEAENKDFAATFKPEKWDFIIIHDPQPMAMLSFLGKNQAKWIWRCHIDLSNPNKKTAAQVKPYLQGYNGAIYTLQQYVLAGTSVSNNAIIPVSIDPLVDKNRRMSIREAKMMVAGYGVDCKRPLIVQISRFDPWKDPLGVVEAWQLAKQAIPDLQLVLMGDAADDDPEGRVVLEKVMKHTAKEKDIYLITDTNDAAVNAFQRTANIVLQKSLREGFGLTVTEALWKKTPVIGGNTGGIPEQVKHGKSGYLVKSPAEAAEYIVKLIKEPLRAETMGLWGHEYVREHFLTPHQLKAQLQFLRSL